MFVLEFGAIVSLILINVAFAMSELVVVPSRRHFRSWLSSEACSAGALECR